MPDFARENSWVTWKLVVSAGVSGGNLRNLTQKYKGAIYDTWVK